MERLITMSNKEITRLEILQRLIDRKITQVQAAEILHMGTRQIQRLVRALLQKINLSLLNLKKGDKNMNDFKWRHYQGQIILNCVRWYCKYGISYRDLEEPQVSEAK
jgi:hypothetical protein